MKTITTKTNTTVTTKKFSDRLAEARKDLGISASEAARRVGVSGSSYYNWERGTSRPRGVAMVRKIAEVMGVTETWLSAGIGEKSAKKQEENIMQAKIEKKEKTTYIVRGKDTRMLEDLQLVLKHLRDMNISREEKEACYLTLAELRNDIECRVVLGERPTVA